jgi:hypothetical protein
LAEGARGFIHAYRRAAAQGQGARWLEAATLERLAAGAD